MRNFSSLFPFHVMRCVRGATRESINLAILTLIETGELTKLQNKWWFDYAQCKRTDKQDASRNELSLSNVAGIFFILIGGLLVALVVALIEFCVKHSRKRAGIGSDGSNSCSSTLASAGATASDGTSMIIIGDGGGVGGVGGGARSNVNTMSGNSAYGSSFVGAMGCGTSTNINNSKHISDSMKSKLTAPSASGGLREYDNGRIGVSIYLMFSLFETVTNRFTFVECIEPTARAKHNFMQKQRQRRTAVAATRPHIVWWSAFLRQSTVNIFQANKSHCTHPAWALTATAVAPSERFLDPR